MFPKQQRATWRSNLFLTFEFMGLWCVVPFSVQEKTGLLVGRDHLPGIFSLCFPSSAYLSAGSFKGSFLLCSSTLPLSWCVWLVRLFLLATSHCVYCFSRRPLQPTSPPEGGAGVCCYPLAVGWGGCSFLLLRGWALVVVSPRHLSPTSLSPLVVGLRSFLPRFFRFLSPRFRKRLR